MRFCTIAIVGSLGFLGHVPFRARDASPCSAPRRHFHSGFRSRPFNIPFLLLLLLPTLPRSQPRSWPRLLRNNLVRTGAGIARPGWERDARYITMSLLHPLVYSPPPALWSVNMHMQQTGTRAHARAPTCARRSMTVHGNLLIHSAARDRGCLVADEISSSLRSTPLPRPRSFAIRAR